MNNVNSNVGQYDITVRQPWFGYIKNGQKKIEGRPNRGIFSKLVSGDIIVWHNSDNICRTKIISIRKYNSFKKMIQEEGLNNILPNINNIEAGVNIYRKFYSEKDENKFGVLAIELSLI